MSFKTMSEKFPTERPIWKEPVSTYTPKIIPPKSIDWDNIRKLVANVMTGLPWILMPIISYFMFAIEAVRNPTFMPLAWMAIAIAIGLIPIVRYFLWLPYMFISLYLIITNPALVNNVVMGADAYGWNMEMPDWQMWFNLSLIPILIFGIAFGIKGKEKLVVGGMAASFLYGQFKD